MIGRLYTVSIGSQAQTAAKTLIEVASAADSVTLIERLWIKQTSFDTSENLGTKTQRITTTGTGTATTPEPLAAGDAAFGGTVETNSTIEPTYTAGTEILEDGFNVLSGYLWTPANDDEVITISPSALVGMNLDVAPSASMNFSYGCTLREIGG
jgi:hypothetical protein